MPALCNPSMETINSNFKLLKASLRAGVPVGTRIDWDKGAAHEVLVYGAHFAIETKAGQPDGWKLALDIFDPIDGQIRTISSSARYQNKGNFIWDFSFGDFSNGQPKKASNELCNILSPETRSRLCLH